MNILVVGSGAREHTIAWKLGLSPRVRRLFVAPGNAGTAAIAQNLNVSPTDIEGLAQAAREHRIDLTVVGPEAPLAAGIVDRFQQLGLPIFGPTQAAAQIEASKGFAKELMKNNHIPCAEGRLFHSYQEAIGYLRRQEPPVVIKADGLAAGKGVAVAHTREQAMKALYDCMEAKVFGPAGERVVIEEFLEGREVSVFAFTDGESLSPLVAACDYKRLLDGDQGPNTGGMGSYSPPEFWTPELEERIRREIMEPAVRAMARLGRPYRGVLYGGLVLTGEGPKVLEFNCRHGDPEAQVVLPRLKTDLVEIVLAVLEGRLSRMPIEWEKDACVGVVLASQGYPGDYRRGLPISGLDSLDKDTLVFHAGTKLLDEGGTRQIVTDGGRVLTVVGRGRTMAEARERAYDNAGRIHFQGVHYRRDIALLRGAVRI